MKISALNKTFTMPFISYKGKKQPSVQKQEGLDVFQKKRRDLTEDEINALKEEPGGRIILNNKNGEADNFIDLIDLNLDRKNAIFLALSKENTLKYIKLAKTDDKGRTVITSKDNEDTTLNGRLSTDEIMVLIMSKHPRLTASLIQTYMDLKDIGLSDKKALSLACSPKLSSKFLTTVTPNDEGEVILEGKNGENIVLKRALTADEALALAKTDNEKIQSYIELVDLGVSDKIALQMIKISARTNKFLNLAKANEEGKVILKDKAGNIVELQRALTADEALIAIREGYSNQKIKEILDKKGSLTPFKRKPL